MASLQGEVVPSLTLLPLSERVRCGFMRELGISSRATAAQLRLVVRVVERVRSHLSRQRQAAASDPSPDDRRRPIPSGGGLRGDQINLSALVGSGLGGEEALDGFSYVSGGGGVWVGGALSGGVEEMESERVAVPAEAGKVDLLSCLPPELAEFYADEKNLVRLGVEEEREEERARVRPPRAHSDRREYGELLGRLWRASMVSFVPEGEFVASGGVLNGLFCVSKTNGALRTSHHQHEASQRAAGRAREGRLAHARRVVRPRGARG